MIQTKESGDNPEISVIITTYNEEDFIADSINALLNQTHSSYEIIIVDDGSEDQTVEIIQSFDDDRIKLLQREHRGHYPALNTAIKHSAGTFIAKVDPDDIPREDRLEKQSRYLRDNTSVGVVGSAYKSRNEIRNETYIRKYPIEDEEIKKELCKYISIPHSSMMFRKSALENVGGYDGKLEFLGEVELLLRMGREYKFANIEEALVTRHIRPDSNFNKTYSDFHRSLHLFRYNVAAVSAFDLPIRFYIYPILSLFYNLLPSYAKRKARGHFSDLDESHN